ncbi:MAG: ROK family protein [Eubacterium sp.]|nr:ROK family protein [Eubacterium sp.]
MVCAVGDINGNIIDKVRIPTTTPDETLRCCFDYFLEKNIDALGIASFGPLDLNINSDTYGYITTTPKPGWQFTDLVGMASKALDVPIGFDTDVNGSLLGEVTFGDARGFSDVVYYTFGTGVGVGVMSGGRLVHGMMHPEAGHMLVLPRDDDRYHGHCSFHRFCLEGMASGPAIEERFGEKGELLSERMDVWELESFYIAQAMVNTILMLSPQRIILGGGVMEQRSLFPLIREKTSAFLNGYINTKEISDIDSYIVPASLNGDQGIKGCFKLALDSVKYAE